MSHDTIEAIPEWPLQAIHPTAAEELVTLAPWGLSSADKKGAH